jgi:signal transduction histidine kinase
VLRSSRALFPAAVAAIGFVVAGAIHREVAASTYLAAHWSWLPAAVLVASIFVAALVAMYFVLLARQTARVEQLVSQRTVELERINAALGQEIAERARAEAALREEQGRLRQMLDLLERDRKLVAYEIHDGFAQLVTGAQMLFQAYRSKEAVDPEEANETFDAALQLLAEGIAEARHLIGGLRPPFLDEAGVVAAVEYLVDEASRRGGPKIEFVHDLPGQRLEPRLEVAIFRILQESLNNALAHSRSNRVRLALVQSGHRLRIEIEDWGVGFDPAKVKPDRFGLEGIRERARLFGGQLVLDTAPGKGTRLVVELPLAGQREPADDPICCASA